MPNKTFIAVHRHEYGYTMALFNADEDALEVINALPQDESDTENPGDLTVVDFAKRININFEPEKGEELTFDTLDANKYDTIDLTDFRG